MFLEPLRSGPGRIGVANTLQRVCTGAVRACPPFHLPRPLRVRTYDGQARSRSRELAG